MHPAGRSGVVLADAQHLDVPGCAIQCPMQRVCGVEIFAPSPERLPLFSGALGLRDCPALPEQGDGFSPGLRRRMPQGIQQPLARPLVIWRRWLDRGQKLKSPKVVNAYMAMNRNYYTPFPIIIYILTCICELPHTLTQLRELRCRSASNGLSASRADAQAHGPPSVTLRTRI
jgi:hypothetical protein